MSVISGSSMNSNMQPDLHVRDAKRNEDDDGEDEFEEQQQANVIIGLFGVIYTVSREKKVGMGFVIFRLFFDALQLLLLTINPKYGWSIDGTATWWRAISLIQLNDFMSARGTSFFLACLYIFVVLLAMNVALCLWVAWSFCQNQFNQVWPIVFLKWFANIFFQVLEIASMTLFLMTLDCNYFDVPDEVRFFNQEFPDKQCWGMPWFIHVAVSVVGLIGFVTMGLLFQMGDIDLNITSKNPLAVGHAKIDVMGFAIKVIITFASVFVTNLKWLAVVYLVFSLVLVCMYVNWEPYYCQWTNYARCAIYTALLYSAVLLMFLQFLPGVDRSDPDEVSEYRRKLTIALVAGLVPVAGLGALASYMRLRFYRVVLVNRFRNAAPGTRPKHIFRFSDPRQVEIVARCCRKWIDEDTLSEDAVLLAEQVMKAGMTLLPGNAYMIILYSSFLIEVQGSYQSGYSQLQAAKKADPSFLERFAIFCREQQHTQKSGQNGTRGDLVSYVEFQRNYRVAIKVHRDALAAMSHFWQCLMHTRVTLETLSAAVARIDETVKHAEQSYRGVLQRHPDSWKLLRMYAKFLEFIKNDPWSASKWNTEADALQQAEEDMKNNVFSDLERSAGDDEAAVKRAKEVKQALDDSRGVVIMNAHCIVTVANQAAHEMFGYSKNELRGKNVKLLIPAPFSEHHDMYVRNYINTGKESILNKSTEFVALHRERYVFAVLLTVVKISGIGEDSMFMGTVEACPTKPDTACAWVLASGAVLSVDSRFTDWFGFKPDDLLGTYVSSLVVEAKKLEETLKQVKAGDMRFKSTEDQADDMGSEAQTHWEVEGVHIRHKFSDPLSCKLSISNGGVGSHHFYIVSIKHQAKSHQMLVADRRGCIRHVTSELAASLGTTTHALMADGAANALDTVMPEPFLQLHRSLIGDSSTQTTPPYSCRSGLSVCLSAVGSDGQAELRPFKLQVKKRDAGGDLLHVVSLEPSSMEQALDERRLSLLVNGHGQVKQVGNSSASLFGFNPKTMVGTSITKYIDILSITGDEYGHQSSAPEVNDAVAAQEQQEILELMMHLARRSVEAPGTSYRVGVMAPIVDGLDMSMLGAMASHVLSRKIKPAVMTVSVHMGGGGHRSSVASYSTSGAQLMPQGSDLTKGPPEVILEVHLWRADLLTGLMELSGAGEVLPAHHLQLYPPGLLFGVGSDNLVKKHIRQLLPLGGRPVSDLFEADLGASKLAAKKGALKGKKGRNVTSLKPGAVSIVRTHHMTDGEELVLRVQAVHKQGGGIWLVLHSEKPVMGMEGFRQWLAAQHTEEPQLPRSLSRPVSAVRASSSFKHNNAPAAALSPGRSPQVMPAVKRTVRQSSPDDFMSLEQLQKELLGEDVGALGASSGGKGVRFTSQDQDSGSVKAESTLEAAPVSKGTSRVLEWVMTGGTVSSHPGPPEASNDAGPAAAPMLGKINRTTLPLDRLAGGLKALREEEGEGKGSDLDASSKEEEEEHTSAGQAKDADKDDARSEGGASSVQDATDANQQMDYKRGQRFKKVARLLQSAGAQKMLKRFRVAAYCVAAAVAVIQVVCFIVLYVLIGKQRDSVSDLDQLGRAPVLASTVACIARSLDLLYDNMGVPGLKHLEGPGDVQYLLDRLLDKLDTYDVLHDGAFLGYRSPQHLPDIPELTTLWNTPSLNVTMYYDTGKGMPLAQYQMMSLWDLGNIYYKKGLNIWQNARAYNHSLANNSLPNATTWDDWSDFQFMITNGVPILVPAYLKTMDSLVQHVVESANSVNNVQLIILALEGCVISSIATIYIWIVTTQVAIQRWNLYNVFMLIPVGLVRGMATRVMVLDDSPLVLEDGEAQQQNGENGGQGATQGGEGEAGASFTAVKINMKMLGQDPASATLGGMVKRMMGRAMFWRAASAKVEAQTPKRQLQRTLLATVWLASPFILWGVVIIIFNAVGYTKLQQVSGPIATFNIVNFVEARAQRVFFFLQELVADLDPATTEIRRQDFVTRYAVLRKEYKAMLYGAAAVPEETAAHFTMAKEGVVFAGGSGADVLYYVRECLSVEEDMCLETTDPMYQFFYNGLDIMFNQFFEVIETTLSMNGSQPDVNSDVFKFAWTAQYHIEGGMERLSAAYTSQVVAVYADVLTLHILALVFTLLIMAVYLLLLMRPHVKRATAETRRIAELLSQLPSHVDVVDLVRRALLTVTGAPAQDEQSAGIQSMKMLGSSKSMESEF
mmetsp:Transcript_29309/g.64857  ORF Transcript_29309/g.64857 Transcript_29309/m.64857 type:complete len:2212 (+) Transcript_29309:218-6853(+)